MGILIFAFFALIVILTIGPATVFKTIGWVLVVIIGIAIAVLPFLNYGASKDEVERAKLAVKLKRANHEDADDEEREYALAKARHQAKYVTTTSIRRLFGKEY